MNSTLYRIASKSILERLEETLKKNMQSSKINIGKVNK